MNDVRKRYESYQTWPHPTTWKANPAELAKAGFYHFPCRPTPDRTVCFACGTAVARWNSRSIPRKEHLRYSPNCPYLNGMYHKYRCESDRKASFRSWPHSSNYLAQPARLAKAGFYHQARSNARDRVVCFCCGLALIAWERNEDPFVEHKKHSSACAFVRGFPTDNVCLPGITGGPPQAPAAPAAPGRAKKPKSDLQLALDELNSINMDYEEYVPQYFMCPITQDIMVEPVVAEDGHTYEAEAIMKWLSANDRSPMTNQILRLKIMFPNHNLRSQLIDFLQQLTKRLASKKSGGGEDNDGTARAAPLTWFDYMDPVPRAEAQVPEGYPPDNPFRRTVSSSPVASPHHIHPTAKAEAGNPFGTAGESDPLPSPESPGAAPAPGPSGGVPGVGGLGASGPSGAGSAPPVTTPPASDPESGPTAPPATAVAQEEFDPFYSDPFGGPPPGGSAGVASDGHSAPREAASGAAADATPPAVQLDGGSSLGGAVAPPAAAASPLHSSTAAGGSVPAPPTRSSTGHVSPDSSREGYGTSSGPPASRVQETEEPKRRFSLRSIFRSSTSGK
eukprot:CAMPEP_0119126236 /NCGR_PEP_ID=MMETSP1310-20130426/5238_1 /TAXON_ID=464262 /ORGANISM="Genus nov. species nov., Strain RCC2339" /LENGTH=561 /DNA_ID=CAMNT_0007116387 /DNA_START=122 /DNA_END=1807 /DNA_ORIENTATION=+